MASFLLTLAILFGVVAAALAVVGWHSKSHSRQRRFWLASGLALGLVFTTGGTLQGCGDYIAGQGDAPAAAQMWATKYRPGWALGECQPRDTDDNKYVTCTLSGPQNEVEPIECGVNRWYHGYGTFGCKQVMTYRAVSR